MKTIQQAKLNFDFVHMPSRRIETFLLGTQKIRFGKKLVRIGVVLLFS